MKLFKYLTSRIVRAARTVRTAPARKPLGMIPDPGHLSAIFDLGDLTHRPRSQNEARIRGECSAVRLDDSVLCRVLGRYKMYVDFRDYGLAPHLMMDGYWEMPVTEAITRFVGSGMSVIDAGANHGYFTVLMADLVGSTGHVFAAEPNPRMMNLLEKSVKVNGLNSRVTSVTEALSSESGHSITLHVPEDFPQNASIKWNGNDRSEGHKTKTLTIDELIGNRNVDFIKIDVEGAEEDVWKGMSALVGRKKPLAILLEFTPNRYADAEGFLRSIVDEGFALAHVTPRNGVQAISVQDVLDGPGDEDQMLILAR